MMPSRAMIMSAGRMGSAEATGYPNANGTRATVPNENEPLVTHDDDYEPAPTRSSLDALQEISRKRIHCDVSIVNNSCVMIVERHPIKSTRMSVLRQDIDNDQTKKAKAELPPSNTIATSEYTAPSNTTMKRARDRTSPSYQKSTPEAQKKRYSRCNDIFSSLSSSAHLLTPKRKLGMFFYRFIVQYKAFKYVLYFATDSIYDQGKSSSPEQLRQQQKMRKGDAIDGLQLSSVSQKPAVVVKPVSSKDTLAESTPPMSVTEKPAEAEKPKLTLFNRDYSTIQSLNDDDYDSENEDGRRRSFVKPKATTSTEFQLPKEQKEKAQKSRLAMMLSCLAGVSYDGTDADEADGGPSKETVPSATTLTAFSIASALTTATTLTFSTATTSTASIAPTAVSVKSGDINAPVSRSLNFEESGPIPIAASKPSDIAIPASTAATTSPAISPITSFASPITATVTPSNQTSTTTAADGGPKAAQRIGGFSFPLTSATPTITSTPNKDNQSVSQPSITTASAKAVSPPTFSFGKKNETVVAPAAAAASTAITTATSMPASVPAPTFSFGAPKPSSPAAATVPSTVATFSFGTTNAVASTNSTTLVNQPTFTFGQANKNAPPATTSLTPSTQPTLSFGQAANAAVITTSAPQFAFNATATTTAAAALNPSSAPAISSFGFGAAPAAQTTNATTAATAAATTSAAPLFSFGNQSKDTAPPVFGTGTTPSFGSSAAASPLSGIKFGEAAKAQATAAFQFGEAPDKSQPPPAFGSNIAIPAFGAGLNATTTTANTSLFAFGTPNSNVATTTAAAQPSIFGTATNTVAPASNANAFGSGLNATFNQPSNNVFGAKLADPPAFGTKPADPPAFGSNTAAPVFGGGGAFASGQAATPAFGSNQPSQSAPLFGGLSNTMSAPPAFGSNNLNATFTNNNQSGIAFGSPGFGNIQPTTTAAPTGFGMTSPSQPGVFSFGSAAPATTTALPFGATPTNTTTSAFGFGSSASNNNTGFFNAAKPEAAVSPFSFNAGPNAQPVPTNPSAFSFNANQASPFGAPAQDASKPFAFGAAAAQPAAPFAVPAFSAASAPPDAKPFTFGSNNNDATKAFNFSAGPATAPAAGQAFNFSASPVAPSLSTNAFQFNAGAAPQNNIFSIGSGGGTTNSKGRPIRQATRRINK